LLCDYSTNIWIVCIINTDAINDHLEVSAEEWFIFNIFIDQLEEMLPQMCLMGVPGLLQQP